MLVNSILSDFVEAFDSKMEAVKLIETAVYFKSILIEKRYSSIDIYVYIKYSHMHMVVIHLCLPPPKQSTPSFVSETALDVRQVHSLHIAYLLHNSLLDRTQLTSSTTLDRNPAFAGQETKTLVFEL
jgi:hypothetical protein